MYGSINSNILKIQQRKIGRIFSRWKWRSFSIWKMYFIICASYWKKIYKMITIDSFLSRNRKLWSLHIDFVFQIQMILEIEKCVNGNFSREKKIWVDRLFTENFSNEVFQYLLVNDQFCVQNWVVDFGKCREINAVFCWFINSIHRIFILQSNSIPNICWDYENCIQ